jgi:signal peptidase II
MTDEAHSPGSPAEGASAPDAEGVETRPEAAAPDKPPEPAPLPRIPVEPPYRPNYVFLAVASIVSLGLDLGSKWWAKSHLEDAKSFSQRHVEIIPKLLTFTFAKNKGGAWGLLQDEPETVRRPFFLGISVLAVLFIVSLYRRLTPQQTALKWGLPLVLGGALGNLVNRIQYNYVVDFIDCYAKWNDEIHHWPTFNIADVAIVVGVGLMAVDMFTSRRPKVLPPPAPVAPPVPVSTPAPSAEEAPRAP